MKFALVSADGAHGKRFWINPETGDATSFLNWIDVWKGFHFNYLKLIEEGFEILKDFDAVMFSGHPGHLLHISQMAAFLKSTPTVTFFYPEGSLQLYDKSIDYFHNELYDAWNACDVVSSAEEDKLSYYQAFIRTETIVRFVHVPLRAEMEQGALFVPLFHKNRKLALVYGDNNPNHPIVAIACAAKCHFDVAGVDIDRGRMDDILKLFPDTVFGTYTKLGQYPFLRILGRCFVHFYPTEWIGTAREQIACAVAGTPCIGNKDSHTQQRLFPELGTGIYDIDGMCALAERLKEDPEFYSRITRKAFEESQFYGLEATKQRFMAAYEDAKKIKQKTLIAT